MNTNNILPCENCLILSVCISAYIKTINENHHQGLMVREMQCRVELSTKCKLIHRYLYKDGVKYKNYNVIEESFTNFKNFFNEHTKGN